MIDSYWLMNFSLKGYWIMRIGLLYDAQNYTWNSVEKDFSLLSEITKIAKGFEELNYEVDLINGINELVNRITQANKAPWDIVMNHISWTRTLKKESAATFLEFYKIPYIGNSQKSLTICADKYITKLLAKELDIPTPKYIYQEYPYQIFPDYNEIVMCLGSPFVMKANGTSGSMGVVKISSPDMYKKKWHEFIQKWHEGILFEKFIEGSDLTIPIISEGQKPRVLGAVQYLDSENKTIPFFSKNLKYYEDISCAKYTDDIISSFLKNYSKKIHIATQCTIFSRCDFRLTKTGEIYFLECNATPEINPNGAFITAGDLAYPDLLQHIITETQASITKT